MLPLTGDERRAFFHSLRTLALPMVLQNLISSAVNSADVLMLGYVGESALSAVSLANQLLFWLYGLFFGISSAIGMLVSQYWGKGDRRSIQAVMGIALKITLVVTSMVSAAAIFLPEPILRIFSEAADSKTALGYIDAFHAFLADELAE
jgi:Na+-driven multidrug efflux pump